jgi:hypothetical protein
MGISFSSLDTFSKCERQWWYKYIMKIPEGPAAQLVVGIVYHEALAYLLEKKTLPGSDQITSWFVEQSTKGYWDSSIDVTRSTEEILKVCARVKSEIVPYLRVEQIETWLPRGGAYTGKIDAILEETPVVDSGAIVDSKPGRCIVDWKTVESAAKAAKNAQYKDHAFQLAMYALPLGIRAGAIIEVPRDGVSAINTSVYSFDDAFLRRGQRWLDTQIAAIETRKTEDTCKLAAWGHSLCSPRFCPYWTRCPGGSAC